MPERWIKLRLHPEHRRILQLSESMQCSRELAFAMAVRWLRHLDGDSGSEDARFSARAINNIVRADSPIDFAAAALGVGWLAQKRDGSYRVRNYNRWIVKDPTANERKRRQRSRVTVTADQTKAESDKSTVDQDRLPRPGPERDLGAWSDRADQGMNPVAKLEIMSLLQKAGIAGRNMPRTLARLEKIAGPHAFLRRIVGQADEIRLVGAAKAGYVFNAIKSESEAGNATAD